MKFFNFRKKDEKEGKSCYSCCSNKKTSNDASCDLLVLGGGCKKCHNLENSLIEALKEMDLNLSVGHVTDFGQIAAYGVMQTPALVYKGKVLLSGTESDKNSLINLLKKEIF